MPKFAAIQNEKIKIISDSKIEIENMKVIELSDELSKISPDILITKYKYKNDKLVCKNDKVEIEKLKVALVSNWKMKCGIATYAEFLWSEIIDYVTDFKLFIEKRDDYLSSLDTIGSKKIDPSNVIPCWERGKSLQNLISEIKNYNPDIIWIQHEFGLFPNAAYWLSMMSQLSDYRIIVTMHSVFHHQDKTICEAAMPEIVVHSEGALKVLKEEKKVSGKISVIPHGCTPCTNKERLWNFYKTDHTIIQTGFLFRYKGWEESLKLISILKNKYPDVFFTGLCSESDNKAEHYIYYNHLMDLITSLNIQENVALIRGYQSEQTWDSYFRTNKVAIFPYISEPEHEVFGASGAARIAMGKYLPVVTSYANHFSDLPTIKAQAAEEMAIEIDKLFSNSKLVEAQLDKQINFLKENSWATVAEKYIKLFEGK